MIKMSWENILKEKLVCPMCGKKAFGADAKAKGKYKRQLKCSECGYKKMM